MSLKMKKNGMKKIKNKFWLWSLTVLIYLQFSHLSGLWYGIVFMKSSININISNGNKQEINKIKQKTIKSY